MGKEEDQHGEMRIRAMLLFFFLLNTPHTHSFHVHLSFSNSLSPSHPHTAQSASPATANREITNRTGKETTDEHRVGYTAPALANKKKVTAVGPVTIRSQIRFLQHRGFIKFKLFH